MLDYTKNDYEKEWARVKSYVDKGLPKSAFELTDTIYNRAKKENNPSQLVKAIIHKLKFMSSIEEDALAKSLETLRLEADQAQFPVRPILHSMLAEMYWNYYEQNRWYILERSVTEGFKQDDIRTWDIKKLVEQTVWQYEASLQDADSAQRTAIGIYDAVLNWENASTPNGRIFRPTLYDFLAHRAIDFFSMSEPQITQPAENFILNNPAYFGDLDQFTEINIETKDTFSFSFHALKAFQELLQFRKDNKSAEALVYADLKRISFVQQNYIGDYKDSLYLNSLQKLEREYKGEAISTEISYHIASFYYTQSKKYNPLQTEYGNQLPDFILQRAKKYKPADFNWEENYKEEKYKWDALIAYTLCEDAIKRFPNSDGAKNCRSLQSTIQFKNLTLKTEDVNLPDEPFRTLVSYQNVPKIYLKVIKTNFQEIENLKKEHYKKTREGNYYIDYERFLLDFYNKKPNVSEFSYDLPNDKDYQQHKTEIKIPALPIGEYIILVGTSPSFTYEKQSVSFIHTTISNLSYISREKNNSIQLHIINRKTGKPVQGVKAQVHEEKYNYNNRYSEYTYPATDSYNSDKDGYITIPPTTKYRNFYLELSYQTDKLYTLNPENNNYYRSTHYYHVPFYQGKLHERDENPNYTQTFLFTDRAIYRPGQTIYFKGIVLEKFVSNRQAKIKVNYTQTVSLYDVNHQQVASLELTTNEFGSFSGSFTAPSGGLTGQMRIQTGNGSIYFSVEEYKRPKFEVNIEKPKGLYRLNDDITVTGKAMAYSGANIDGASVSYRVVRRARFPYWWFCWYGFYPSSPQMEITNGITNTDENGTFKINFSALPDLAIPTKSQPIFTYEVSADVTDLNGETHSNSTFIQVGYSALQLDINIAEEIDQNEKFEVAINTSNLSGEFEPAKGTVKIYHLKAPDKAFRNRLWERPDKFIMKKEEFYKTFPYDLYDDEDNFFKWEKSAEVLSIAFDTEKSKTPVIVSNNKGLRQGKYMVEAITKDKYGVEVKEIKYFTLFDGTLLKESSASIKEPAIPLPTIDWFVPIKTTVEPNETAKLLAGSSEKINVLYEIEHQGEIIRKEWLNLSEGQHVLSIPIKEEHRGNLGVHYTFIKNNRLYNHSEIITVPYTNKQLDISFETFRNKLLPGAKEEWKLLIKGKSGDKVAAEMLATLYDASLDAFRSNNWYFNPYNSYYNRLQWQTTFEFNASGAREYNTDWNHGESGVSYTYDLLNWFDYPFYQYYARGGGRYREDEMITASGTVFREGQMAEPPEMDDGLSEGNPVTKSTTESTKEKQAEDEYKKPHDTSIENPPSPPTGNVGEVQIRKNFSETAFFYPHLQTNEKGEIYISFTVPEALTKWKMLGLAHTKDVKYGLTQNTLVTQKELMIVPNAPRFFREGDEITFTAKVTNLSEKDINGEAQIELLDALTMKPLQQVIDQKYILSGGAIAVDKKGQRITKELVVLQSDAKQSLFQIKKGQSTVVSWTLKIPQGIEAITYRVTAKAGNFSDGEEMAVPILTNRMLVTETLPLSVRGNQPKTFRLEKLINNSSGTLRQHKLTLEYSSNPAWYAVQALPYLMEYPYECAEQTFNRFYANSLAAHISNSNQKIKRVFDTWKNYQPEALLSNLEKNQELKSLLLEETPWVRDAKNESERKKRIALLFDLNKMSDELQRALNKLAKMQFSNGAWGWFEGMPENRYMTQYIVTGMGHLDNLGVKNVRSDQKAWTVLRKAIGWLDNQLRNDYEEILRNEKRGYTKLSNDHLNPDIIHYFYARSYFKDINVESGNQKAFNYFKEQFASYWNSYLKRDGNKYTIGMLALAMHRYGYTKEPQALIKSLKEHSLNSEEMGMYWKENAWGYYWYEAPIETQALMIEVFDEIANDQKAVDDLKVWLLKQKQTQDWRTTKATAEACYALLLRGDNWLENDEHVSFKVGDKTLNYTGAVSAYIEQATGYFKTSWNENEIKPEMGKITVTPPANQKGGVSWGALYWQYFEQLDKITPSKTPLQLSKKLFLQKNTSSRPTIVPIDENTSLKPGDKVTVRIELRVDRTMEYVHLKDMRASCFEPLNVISRYKWQDGLGYYESTRDASTNFFFSYLRKGTYVFEYPLYVTHKGNFSNGITSIQCMYAPEFTSHSEGIRVTVK